MPHPPPDTIIRWRLPRPLRSRPTPGAYAYSGPPRAGLRPRTAPEAPIDSTDPFDPIDRMDPFDPIDRMLPLDPTDKMLPALRTLPRDRNDPTESQDSAEARLKGAWKDHVRGGVMRLLSHRHPRLCRATGPRPWHIRRMGIPEVYSPDPLRYDGRMPQRRCGRSGLTLPAVSLGFWQNFGDTTPVSTQRAMMRAAFDAGITHFDLANNYGPPHGAAETNVGRILREDFRGLRDELVVSTKAGFDMWPGPYGEFGSRKHLLASLDQSLQRLGLDYVDVFYSHRPDPDTPLEETMGALASAVHQGKALYAGISSYSATDTARAAGILADSGVALLVHQPVYSMLNRWIEPELLDTLASAGAGCVVFSPLSQGMLTTRYLHGVPEGSRAARADSLKPDWLTPAYMKSVGELNAIAAGRGQTLAQMAVAWTLRDPRVTSAVIGTSSVEQLRDTAAAAANTSFAPEELAAIDRWAHDGSVQEWVSAGTRRQSD
jgi:L-glyceraldehyde 3-phosphate reductase